MNVENSLKFSGQLRVLLYKAGISQTAFADGIGVSKQVISKWLNGQSVPDIVNFRKIKEFFNVPYEFLYGDEENKPLWDLTPEFGVAVEKALKSKKMTAEDLQQKTGINQGFTNRLIKYGKTKETDSMEFCFKSEFGIRDLDYYCETLGLDIHDYTVMNQHSKTVSPYRSDEEAIIKAYRENPDMQAAVRKLLDLE